MAVNAAMVAASMFVQSPVPVLQRRINQSVAEYEVLNMLEQS